MSLSNDLHQAWRRLIRNARIIWSWHHRQMNTNSTYSRIIIDTAVRALWQDSVERFLRVLVRAAIGLLITTRFRYPQTH